jgi:hypothetical protein
LGDLAFALLLIGFLRYFGVFERAPLSCEKNLLNLYHNEVFYHV